MKQLKFLRTWLLLLCLALSTGVMWGEEYSFTIQTSDFNTTSYVANNGSHDFTATCKTDASKTMTVACTSYQVMQSSSVMQWQKNSGYIYNTTDLGTIKSVTVNSSAGTFTTNYGTSEHPTSGTTVGNGFFTVKVGSATGKTSSIVVVFEKNAGGDTPDTRTAVNMTGFLAASTTLIKDNTTTTSVSNNQNGWTPSYTYESDNTAVATVDNDGIITAAGKGTAKITASLNIDSDDTNWKIGDPSSMSIDITVNNPSHNYTFYSNGIQVSSGSCEEGEAITFPADPAVDDVVFMGWTTAAIDGTQNDAPTMVDKASTTMGNSDVTYYAVFAIEEGESATETKTQTLEYDTWTYSGSTTDKKTYRLFHSGSYIESESFDRSKLSKVIVYGGTFGGASYNSLTISDGTNTWKNVTVSGSSETGTNTYTDGTALSGTGTIRITSNSGSTSNTGVRISKVEIYTMEGGYSYSDYCTTVTHNLYPTHTVTFYANDVVFGTLESVREGANITFPSDEPEVDGVKFMGWTTTAIVGNQDAAPEMVNTAIMGEGDVAFYAVFAVQEGEASKEQNSQTLEYDTWVYGGSTTDKDTYRLFHEGGYVESASFDLSKLTKVVVYGGTYGGDTYNKLTISDGTNIWKTVTVKGKSETGSNEYTNGNALSGEGKLIITSNSGSTGGTTGSGVRISKVEIFTMEGGYTYSDYCTTVSVDPKVDITLSSTALEEYVGNANETITVRTSDGYTGTLSATSDASDKATAEIVDGKVKITAKAAGTATITVTAPTVDGFRKNTATIAVTVSEKLAHGLSFSADALNLTVGDTEFTEPTLSNPNSLPVVYSLVYATPANEGKVATINAETGKITLADPSLSTEIQGAVTVKASTDGDNSHVAGEVTYNLVVARKATTTSWSNEGAAVTIDKDEIDQLPTASNTGGRNIQYESSKTDVATIADDGAVTFVAYGTTTITAKTYATAEYAATSTSYELTFAPRYTVTFSINGETEVVREETFGAGVTAPKVETMFGKAFLGWIEEEIEGTTDTAPTFVANAGSNLDGNKTYYAVFATATGSGEGSVDFTLTSIDGITTGNAERTQTTEGITFTFSNVCDANVSGNHYVQMAKNSTLTQDKPFAGNIKSITFEGFNYSSTDKASMLVEGKKGTNGEYATVQSCDAAYNGDDIDFGSIGYDMFKITVGSERAVKFTKMTVNYSGVIYSGYCTTVPNTATITLNPACHTGVDEQDEKYNVYGTYSCSSAFVVPETIIVEEVGVNADGKLNVKAYETGDIVPANTGVMVHAATGGDYTIVLTNGVGESVLGEDNRLRPSGDEDITVAEMEEKDPNCVYYRLTMHNGTQIGFWWGAADGAAFTLAANKAYLAVPKNSNAKVNGVWVEAETNGISSVNEDVDSNETYYNIAGQRVNASHKGIVIVNGRKFINK